MLARIKRGDDILLHELVKPSTSYVFVHRKEHFADAKPLLLIATVCFGTLCDPFVLGYLLRDGRPREAEAAYKRAVELNASNDEARAAAYLGLAKAARARDDDDAVRGYATVVVTLFEKTASAAEAKEMLK